MKSLNELSVTPEPRIALPNFDIAIVKSPVAIRNYVISPTDLVYLWADCRRCFYDKVVAGFKRPSSFSEHFTSADRAMRKAVADANDVDLGVGQRFRLLAQGEWVESLPIAFPEHGVSFTFKGQFDAVVVTESDEVFVVDYKTTSLDDHALDKFFPQLMSYVTAIELPGGVTTLPAYVDGMAILVFNPAAFAYNPKTKNCGLFGKTRWTEIPRDTKRFDDLLRRVAEILASPFPPQPVPRCGICQIRFGTPKPSKTNALR